MYMFKHKLYFDFHKCSFLFITQPIVLECYLTFNLDLIKGKDFCWTPSMYLKYFSRHLWNYRCPFGQCFLRPSYLLVQTISNQADIALHWAFEILYQLGRNVVFIDEELRLFHPVLFKCIDYVCTVCSEEF